MPRRLVASLSRQHVTGWKRRSFQIGGLELAIGGVHPSSSSSVLLFHTIISFSFTLLRRYLAHHTQQHTSPRRERVPAQHGSSQAYHQGDGASHGRAVGLFTPDHQIHVLTTSDSVPGIEAIPHDDNLRYFDVKIHGPSQSPYEGTPSQPRPPDRSDSDT
jgi:hypothetical protein